MPIINTLNDFIIALAALIAALTAIVGGINLVYKPFKQLKVLIEDLKRATRATIKSSLTRTHREYSGKGEIDHYTLDSVHDMYEQYKALGGNGYMETIVKELNELEISGADGIVDREHYVDLRPRKQ